MATDRYVVLGLARARAAWFSEVARWSTSAVVPVEFLKVVSVAEVRARLRSGRPFSALLADIGLPGLDRDLVELATAQGCAVVVVDDGSTPRPWRELGVAAALPPSFGRDQLLDTLHGVARPIARRDRLVVPAPAPDPSAAGWRGRVVAVTGAGGVGRSTLAMALAGGLGADPRDRGLVVLADLALHAHQALLHEAGDVVPGVLELVEAHRGAGPSPDGIRDLCFSLPDRGYDLLLGLRRHRDWTALQRRAAAATLDGLCRAYRLVVADTDPDVEGEAECGSDDVEDRNVLARTALRAADLVVAVGLPTLPGIHAHVRVVRDLRDVGVRPSRIMPVVNRAPRNPRARAELASALARLLVGPAPDAALACTPVFVPERRRLDDLVRDGLPPPAAIAHPLAGAVRALLDRTPAAPPAPDDGEPVAVAAGSLGSWSPDAEAEGT